MRQVIDQLLSKYVLFGKRQQKEAAADDDNENISRRKFVLTLTEQVNEAAPGLQVCSSGSPLTQLVQTTAPLADINVRAPLQLPHCPVC